MESAPTGRRLALTTSSTMRWVSQAVGVAGFISTATPDKSAGAAFSQRPQAGKLKALMKTATPSRGLRKCCAWNTPDFESGIKLPSLNDLPSRLAPHLAYCLTV